MKQLQISLRLTIFTCNITRYVNLQQMNIKEMIYHMQKLYAALSKIYQQLGKAPIFTQIF
jgi:hypothetical protein